MGKVRKTNVKRSARGASGKKPVAVTVQERKKKGGFKGSWFLPVLAEKSLPPFAVGKRMPCDGVGTIDYNISLPKTERLDLVCVRAFGHLMERSKLTQSWLRSNTAKLNKSPTDQGIPWPQTVWVMEHDQFSPQDFYSFHVMTHVRGVNSFVCPMKRRLVAGGCFGGTTKAADVASVRSISVSS